MMMLTLPTWNPYNGKSLQWTFGALNSLLGTPFAEAKQQPLNDEGTFLGLDYDFNEIWSTSSVFFWVRARLESKVVTMMNEACSSGILMPSQASKLYGTLNFLESGVFGRVGCGGLQPFKDHQYGRVFTVCPRLAKCFDVMLVASDAALEGPRCGSGGFLVLWHPRQFGPERPLWQFSKMISTTTGTATTRLLSWKCS